MSRISASSKEPFQVIRLMHDLIDLEQLPSHLKFGVEIVAELKVEVRLDLEFVVNQNI